MDETWIILNPEEDVISQQFNSPIQKIEDLPLNFTGIQILDHLREQLSEDEQAFIDGFECKVLQPGKKWQTGKIRINVEFCPDNPSEPDSPLDEIRKMDP